MQKLNITCYGLELYVDGDKDDADRISRNLKRLLDDVCGVKCTMRRHRVGIVKKREYECPNNMERFIFLRTE